MARFGDAPEPELREPVAVALYIKGEVLRELGHLQRAVHAYDQVVVRFGDAPEPELHEQVAKALGNEGAALETSAASSARSRSATRW